jgi:hypothetical protein
LKLLILLTLALGLVSQKIYAAPQLFSAEEMDFKFTPSYPVFDIYQQKTRPVDGRKEITFANDFVERMRMGADFRLSFQDLESGNVDKPDIGNLDAGFTNARANWFWDIEVSKGISTFFNIYLSSEHHLEVYMREGYFFIDELPGFKSSMIDDLMKLLSAKAGQFEINYGDWHLRRTNNGEVQRNPVVGNYLIDANTTEIGMEIMADKGNFQFLGAFTGGTNKEDITPKNGYGWYFKLGFDKKFESDSRLRIAASYYGTNHRNTTTKSELYSGNRSGSPYRGIFKPNVSTGYDAGQLLPDINSQIGAYQINLVYQIKGLEIFGTYEMAQDRNALGCGGQTTGTTFAPGPCAPGGFGAAGAVNTFNVFSGNKEAWSQWAIDLVYRFSPEFHIAGRYNVAEREDSYNQTVSPADYKAKMYNIGIGYFIPRSTALIKIEYMNQEFTNFLKTDYYANYSQYGANAKANGFTIEGSLTF